MAVIGDVHAAGDVEEALSSNAEDLQLERGILQNYNRFSAVFRRIIMKYNREFEETEDGGAVIDFKEEDLFERDLRALDDKSSCCSVGSDNDDDDDVIVVGEDMLDPELTTKLHERVLQIKKEINWSDEEDQEEDTQESELIIEETITSQTEYEDINTCSDTELESDTSLVSLDQLVYPDSVSSSLKVTRQGISGNNTHNCTPRYPILSIEKTPVHIRNRATEPLPRHAPIHPYSPPHSQPQYSSREFPTHSDHLEPPCFFCFNFHSAQSLRRNCLCPECSQIQDTSICSCPDCRDSLQLHFNPLPSYTVATQLCGCPACSEQPIVGNRLYTTTCDCQDCTRVKRPLQPAQEHRRGKRLLDIESSTSEYPVIKRPCT